MEPSHAHTTSSRVGVYKNRTRRNTAVACLVSLVICAGFPTSISADFREEDLMIQQLADLGRETKIISSIGGVRDMLLRGWMGGPPLCLDGSHSGRVAAATCSHAESQVWILRDDGTILNADRGLCLEFTTLDDPLQLVRCNAAVPQQQWVHSGSNPGVVIMSKFNEECLDIQRARQESGTPVQTYICRGTANQRWSIVGLHA